jgi:hypothetical protein
MRRRNLMEWRRDAATQHQAEIYGDQNAGEKSQRR